MSVLELIWTTSVVAFAVAFVLAYVRRRSIEAERLVLLVPWLPGAVFCADCRSERPGDVFSGWYRFPRGRGFLPALSDLETSFRRAEGRMLAVLAELLLVVHVDSGSSAFYCSHLDPIEKYIAMNAHCIPSETIPDAMTVLRSFEK